MNNKFLLKKPSRSFFWIVLIPTVLSALYFGFIASDRYVSVSSFVVRSPQKSTSVSGLSAFLQNVGFTRSTDDSYVIHQYMLSRDAVKQLNENLSLDQKYRNSKIDLFSRFNTFGFSGGLEDLYEYYQNRVNIDTDTASSISTLTVRAYTAQDAHDINAKLLDMAESLVNQLNTRGRSDVIVSSEREVNNASERVNEISKKITEFRVKNKIFDVNKQSELRLQMISKLQDQLLLVRTQLAQIQAVTPENPQIRVMQERELKIRQDIEKETSKALVGDSSLNQKSGEYESLMLEKEVATKQLAAAMSALEQSKNEAQRQQLYLERVSQPLVPDSAIEPKRVKNILSVLLLSLLLWGIFVLLKSGVQEHQG